MIILQDNGHRKILIFAYIALIILAIGLIIGKFRTEVSYTGPEKLRCESRAEPYLTSNTGYFSDTVQGIVIDEIGGMPIEGFEPFMFMQAFPGLVIEDFDCVEAFGGQYEVRGAELVFVKKGDPNIQTSADNSVTSQGMERFLENLGRRLGKSLSTTEDVDAIIEQINY